MNALLDEFVKNVNEFKRNVNETERLVRSLFNTYKEQGFIQHKSKELHMDTIRDALLQTSNGRKIVVQVTDDMRTKAIARERAREEARRKRIEGDAIRGRIRTLKDLVHYTFVQFPRENSRQVRFDVYQASKDHVRDIAAEGGEAYERLTRTLQFAHTSRKSFEEAVASLADCEHDFSEYESSDIVRRHAA